MLFTFTCIDKPDAADLRQKHRPEHLAYLDSVGARLKLAGALLDDAGLNPCGSLLIVDCADRADADTFASGDPFAKVGLFAEVVIRPLRQSRPVL